MSDNYLKDKRANTVEGWIEAFKILAKYGDASKFFCYAEHDILYLPFGPPDDTEDAQTLRGLGFHRDSETGDWAKFT